MENRDSSGNAGKYSLVILLALILILTLTVPSRSNVSTLITQTLSDKTKGMEFKDPVLKTTVELGMLKVFVESKIVESNYFIFKIFTINDASIVDIILTQPSDEYEIKFIGLAGQLIRLAPSFDYSSKPSLKSKVVTSKETEIYITNDGTKTKETSKSSQKSGYSWDTEIINDASVDYVKDIVLLRIYRKSWAAAILNIAGPDRVVTISFDWEIESEGWAGTPAISTGDSQSFSVKDCDLALKRNCGDIIAMGNRELRMRHFGRTKGSYQAVVHSDKLIFYIIPSETSDNEGHANTYFKIYNLQIL